MSNATAVRERPIIFSGESVRAILDGTKTQTRRVLKILKLHGGGTPTEGPGMRARVGRFSYDDDMPLGFGAMFTWSSGADLFVACPYGVIGDRLWVRETWGWLPWCYQGSYGYVPPEEPKWPPYYDGPGGHRYSVVHRAGSERNAWGMTGEPRWRSPIFMPRTACRVTLEITDVRVERLRDITEADAIEEGVVERRLDLVPSIPMYEGVGGFLCSHAANAYAQHWDTINAKRGYPWASNPFVWALSFRVLP